MEFTQISDGVTAGFIKADRFKTSAISLSFYTVPQKSELSANALALSLMKSGCSKYPDTRSVNLKLGELYGAKISTSIQKIGDCFDYRISLYCIDDRFTYGQGTAEDAVMLLKDLVFEKYLLNEDYPQKIFQREKRLLCEQIAGEINEKRTYALGRLLETVCEGEPFGFAKYGSAESAEALTPADVRPAFSRLLKNSAVNITVIGSSLPRSIYSEFGDMFQKTGRDYQELKPQILKSAKPEPCYKTENMEVAQGKLCIGLRSENGGVDRVTAATLVMCDLFGGGPHSKLFLNVRERMSLCYYCSAVSHRRKGVIVISSGVEKENIAKAREEILKQFEAVKSGEFSAEDLARSKRSLTGSLNSIKDDLPSLLNWYSIRSAYRGELISPEEMCRLIQGVGSDDVIKAAKEYSLDTVYTLEPKED